MMRAKEEYDTARYAISPHSGNVTDANRHDVAILAGLCYMGNRIKEGLEALAETLKPTG